MIVTGVIALCVAGIITLELLGYIDRDGLDALDASKTSPLLNAAVTIAAIPARIRGFCRRLQPTAAVFWVLCLLLLRSGWLRLTDRFRN
jgi:hypothetical protein